MIALLVLHLVVGVGILVGGARLGNRAALVAAIAPAATVVWLIGQIPGVVDGEVVEQTVAWMPTLGVDLQLRLDGFAAVMVLLVSGIGTLVFAYASEYFPRRGGSSLSRLLGLLVLFSGSMLGLVLADNLLILYGFWELTSVTSFLLIGNDTGSAKARAAALQALLITGAGGLAMLAGFLLLGHEAGTFQLSAILSDPPAATTTVGVALALVLLGAFTKSAQYPFHSWLPGAMVAPTPVSAYLHSATMVKAGVYLVARLSPVFALAFVWWRPVVVGVGLVTMVAGGLRALRQHDLKVLLAYSTISQLGLLMVTFGIGSAEAAVAGTSLLLAHGLFKAGDFMVVGILDHQIGTRDLRCLPRLDRSWWPVATVAIVSSASMAGLPLLFGFVAKEAALQTIVDSGQRWWMLALAGVVVGSSLTAAYSARFAWGALGRDATEPVEVDPSSVRPSWRFVLPAIVLALATLELGVLPSTGDGVVGAAEVALHPGAHGVHLAIWHGWNLALALSVVATAAGIALFLGRRRVAPLLAVGRRLPDGSDGYRAALRGLLATADRVTAISQPGALPIYAGVILLMASLLPLVGLLDGGGAWPGWPSAVGAPAAIPISIVLVVAALASSVVRRRFSAALFLGVVGYAMAGLFMVLGSPDLALTQAAIETLSTVLFVLVLRRLPDRFSWRGEGAAAGAATGATMDARRRALRVGAALAVALSVFVLAIVMNGPSPATDASDDMVELALPEGQGRNVTNVILVDFRGLDTLGEITVLAMAAIGTVALARAGRRRVEGAGTAARGVTGLPDAVAPPLGLGRLLIVDVAVRVVFATVMVTSVYLLFVGHNQPGGGFVGGILAGAAVSLLYVAGGIDEVRKVSRGRPWTILGLGLAVAVGTALLPLALGDPVLSNGYVEATLPLLGHVKLTSATAFDLGVYLCVLGLALMVFESFGDEPVADGPEPSVVAGAGEAP